MTECLIVWFTGFFVMVKMNRDIFTRYKYQIHNIQYLCLFFAQIF